MANISLLKILGGTWEQDRGYLRQDLDSIENAINRIPISTSISTLPIVVTDTPYLAKGDGASDNTAAFQRAVNAAYLASGVVYVPPGRYVIAGPVTVPIGVTIQGDSTNSSIRPTTGLVTLGNGAIILAVSTTNSPFLYSTGNCFRGLTFYYPNQLRTASTPTVYPATFAPASTGGTIANCVWNSCQFSNSYIWIDALVGHLDFVFDDLVGCPVRRGIRTDGGGGTDTFRHIRGSYYYWCQFGDTIVANILANAIGLEIGRSDAVILDDVFMGTVNAGIRLYLGTVNTSSGPYGSASNLSFDGCNYGLYVEATHPIGLEIHGLMSNTVNQDIEIPNSSNPIHLELSNIICWGAGANAIRVSNDSSVVRANHFAIFDKTNAGIRVSGASCHISFIDGYYSGMSTDLVTTAACSSLMLSHNLFGQAPTINGTPGTILRYRGNAYLADTTTGG